MRTVTLALAAICSLALAPTALASGTIAGATRAVVHAVAEEGGSAVYAGTPQVHCRHTTPSRFGCSFRNLTRGLGGRVTVSYKHRRYYVGEARYEQPAPAPPVGCITYPGSC